MCGANQMSNNPPYLKKGDKIAITCPAKKLPGNIDDAIQLLESWGLEVVLGETVTASYNQFAGDDELRTRDFQRFLDDDSVKAIIAARGGYGSIRIIDTLDFSPLKRTPKWIVGFSDITVFHSHIQANYNLQTIHGQMPMNIPDATKPSLQSLKKALFGEDLVYTCESDEANICGDASGVLIGGNLSLLVAVNGSVSEMDFTDKILFLEDVGEYLYSVDRMLWNLSRANKLSKLKGMVVGGFTDLKDNDIPFGESVKDMILSHALPHNYPVCFDFPAGHIADNQSLVFGKNVNLSVGTDEVKLAFV
ncbi:MAG: LD-carboxypeptidase [Sphingobacteriaceae bacterium]|jgi:muramoyltetrapeptide carboxypeptidase|nr:LD-carboxypeptidase [Sphingobacteriaceae bacterium]